ncbi:MAG: helix-turn-helix domain-containing protein [Polyangiaceae bacterium]
MTGPVTFASSKIAWNARLHWRNRSSSTSLTCPSEFATINQGTCWLPAAIETSSISLEDVERRYILRVLDACSGNRTHAARVLGIGRKTLYRRLALYGVLGGEGQGIDDGAATN